MDLKFEEWLGGQQLRKDFIGSFARAIQMKTIDLTPSRYKRDEHKIWADIVTQLNVSEGYTVAFNAAWQEFLLAKQMTQDLLDK